MTTRRFLAIGPDSADLVDLYVDGALKLPALNLYELRELREQVEAALAKHPGRDLTYGPDGRLYCVPCTDGHRADECDRHEDGYRGCACPCGGPKLCAERCGLAAEPGDIYCDGCRSGVEYAREAGALR